MTSRSARTRDRAQPGEVPDSGPSALAWLPLDVRAHIRARELAPDDALFHRGDPAQAIFHIERGRMRLECSTRDGRTVILHTAGPGELFAEAALFSDAYHCDAVALASSRVHALPKKVLLPAMRADARLAQRFMAVLARQVQGLRAQIQTHRIRSARERVLHALAVRADSKGAVSLAGSLMEFAAEIGLTHEVLYRTLASLEKDGMIERIGAVIRMSVPGGA